jgi:signal transduction histidine kinase
MILNADMYNLHKKIILFCCVGLIFCCYTYGYAATQEHFIRLDGMHKFSAGDDPAWAFPDYDDAQWQKIHVPGSWQSQRMSPEKDMGWYRIYFSAPDSLRDIVPAILIGRIGDVDEVFLNGIKIGREGLIGDRFVEATKVERLYRIPKEFLRYDSTNLIAIRVMNTYLNGGIFDSGVTIGDYNALVIDKLKRTQYSQMVEFCFFTFFALFFVTCFFFYIKGLRDKEYITFWLFISLYGILFALESVTFYNTGLKFPSVQQLINTLSTILPVGLILLLFNVYQERLSFPVKIFLLAFPLLALLIILLPGHGSRLYLFIVWKILFVFAAILIVFHSIRAYFKKFHESGPILLGISGLLSGLILESVGGLDLLQITGFFLWDYSAVFFMVCVMYALTARYTRIQEELRSASLKIFDAHEDERKRLARDLHDGIGQSLLSVKLRLKMLESKAKEGLTANEESFSELVSDVAHSIDEIRAVARDLRPSFLENIDFIEALKWHSEKMQEQSGILITVSSDGLKEMNARVKENIYRIYQEALSNAIKHSGARAVDVILKTKNSSLSLEIRDDGVGFDPARTERGRTGIGLYTIKERVELLGGILRIKSSDKMGTSLYIEVPLV